MFRVLQDLSNGFSLVTQRDQFRSVCSLQHPTFLSLQNALLVPITLTKLSESCSPFFDPSVGTA